MNIKDYFYNPVHIREKDSDILFWCCMHNGHDPKWEIPIWKRRGYESAQAHTNGTLEAWNRKANNNTVGFLLGDNIFNEGAELRLLNLFNDMKFRKLYIMPGNHYAGWRQVFNKLDKNTNELVLSPNKRVIFVPNYLDAIINGQSIVMSHYPILSWNGMGGGSWMLFGHVHGSLSESELGRMYLEQAGKTLEVSVEVAPEPLTFGEIRIKMDKKERGKVDHHGKDTQNPF